MKKLDLKKVDETIVSILRTQIDLQKEIIDQKNILIKGLEGELKMLRDQITVRNKPKLTKLTPRKSQ